jgi:phosphoethanolamine N-methyltransferase
MAQDIEYHDAMIRMLELIWGEGYMAPGGTGLTDSLVDGLDLAGKNVLDIGSGLGGPVCHLAKAHGAVATGVDIEPHLIELSRRRAQQMGVRERAHFVLVEPGPLPFEDNTFDAVISAGALTQIADKAGIFSEVLRVLRPGGSLRSYEWTTSAAEPSADMIYFFKMEGLTYALETAQAYGRLLRETGFVDVQVIDDTPWYRRQAGEEYERMRGELYSRMIELLGRKDADHFVEDWRSMVVVWQSGELTQHVIRARKAA